MRKTRVGVVRGGPGNEYDVSLKTGETVLKNLPEKYEPVDIFIDKYGIWHVRGVRFEPKNAVKQIDVIFNAMHGEYGEDGQIQEFLDKLGVPYTGSGSFASRIAMNKALTKSFVGKEGIQTPRHIVLSKDDYRPDIVIKIFSEFPLPSVIKPLSLGSSVGISIARDFSTLEEALKKAFNVSERVIIEEFIQGREATCGVVDNFAGEIHYALSPIEIMPPKNNDFYDYEAKYISDNTRYVIPGNFSDLEKEKIQQMSKLVHKTLNLKHYSRSDFIVNPKRGVYFLEVNTLPGLTSHSLIPKSMEEAGYTLPQFLDHVLTLALKS